MQSDTTIDRERPLTSRLHLCRLAGCVLNISGYFPQGFSTFLEVYKVNDLQSLNVEQKRIREKRHTLPRWVTGGVGRWMANAEGLALGVRGLG